MDEIVKYKNEIYEYLNFLTRFFLQPKRMTWQLMWRNVGAAELKAMLQLLVIYWFLPLGNSCFQNRLLILYPRIGFWNPQWFQCLQSLPHFQFYFPNFLALRLSPPLDLPCPSKGNAYIICSNIKVYNNNQVLVYRDLLNNGIVVVSF